MSGNVCYAPEVYGEIKQENVVSPVAGTDWRFTIPSGFVYEIAMVYFVFVTGGPGHNHSVVFDMLDDLANEIHAADVHQIIQNQTHIFNFYIGASRESNASSDDLHIIGALPQVKLLPGYSLGTVTGTIDITDQYSNIRLIANRWKIN